MEHRISLIMKNSKTDWENGKRGKKSWDSENYFRVTKGRHDYYLQIIQS